MLLLNIHCSTLTISAHFPLERSSSQTFHCRQNWQRDILGPVPHRDPEEQPVEVIATQQHWAQ